MKRNISHYCAFLGALFLSITLQASENTITALVNLSPAGSFQISSSKIKGQVIKKSGKFIADKLTVSVESLKTGIDLRDEHLWKHLNSSQHPKIILNDIKSVSEKIGTAQLEVNGVKNPISFEYTEKDNLIEATFEVKPSSFKLPKAEYMGVGVKDLVRIKAVIAFEKTK